MSNATANSFGPKGWTPENLPSLEGKTYVITGASSGIGYEATKIFVSKGAKVVMLCHLPNETNAAIAQIRKEFPSADITLIEMDLGSLASVRSAAEKVSQEYPQIDALICNAGISLIAKQKLTEDGFECQIGVNHYGHFLLCGLLFDNVEAAEGRIVIVGSISYKMGLRRVKFEDLNFDNDYSPMNSYVHSKLVLMTFAYELQRRATAAGKNIQVQVGHPGGARTNLGNEGTSFITKWTVKTVGALMSQSAVKGSWPTVLCTVEEGLEPGVIYGPTKRNNLVGPIQRTELEPHVLDKDAAAKVWKISEEKTGLSWSP